MCPKLSSKGLWDQDKTRNKERKTKSNRKSRFLTTTTKKIFRGLVIGLKVMTAPILIFSTV